MGWGAQGSKEPLAAAGQADLGSVARMATDVEGAAGAEGGLEDWQDAAKDSGIAPATAQAGTGEASRGVVGGVDAGPHRAADDADAAGGGLAVASPVPSGGDAVRRAQVSNELCSNGWLKASGRTRWKDKQTNRAGTELR
ncbi:hypothetical protein K505DRAFT_336298 [Melanomma pulvis-pyrius CBS 109.77]|uniref:Uncharacterized protein n=1 Tax=Melanomma pulvis-pyrius CBS 109.77 TaxID=1314802 RepID=A0A6A6XH10_9PLEO|nr:hypothetical protein K505DRAFT_336298 [Melanomma pulvis-pyrius CBS 109.77]